jgi:hypothetical protein
LERRQSEQLTSSPGEVVVHGSVQGNVHAKQQIEIKKGGSVLEDLITPRPDRRRRVL